MGRSKGRRLVLATLEKCHSTLDTVVIHTVPVILPASFSRLSKLGLLLVENSLLGGFHVLCTSSFQCFCLFQIGSHRALGFPVWSLPQSYSMCSRDALQFQTRAGFSKCPWVQSVHLLSRLPRTTDFFSSRILVIIDSHDY